MGNLIEIQNQIEKLQRQAAEIKSREFQKTVQDILSKMQAFGITLKDLQRAMGKGGRKTAAGKGRVVAFVKKPASKRSRAVGTTVAPKYRVTNGETWSGRGLMPRWLATLVAEGRTKEEFAVAPCCATVDA